MNSHTRTLVFRDVKTLKDAFILARLRNECAIYMTRNKQHISIVTQIWWYFAKYQKQQSHNTLHAFIGSINNRDMCYGLVRKEVQLLISGGLKKSYRGRGMGKKLFRFLLDWTSNHYKNESVFLEVLTSNSRAINLYQQLGFREYRKSENILYMHYKKT